jgi:hypothetical protein
VVTVTEEEIRKVEEILGIKLLRCQKDMLKTIDLSGEKKYFVIFPRSGRYIRTILATLLAIRRKKDIKFVNPYEQTVRIVDGLCGRRFLIDPIDDAADPCVWPKVNPYIKKDGKKEKQNGNDDCTGCNGEN